MRVNDLPAWHNFTYRLVYPAVLGSMLYDALSLARHTDIVGWTKLSIVLFYCLDYLHLHADFASDHPNNARWQETVLDLVVAILLGIAYWSMSREDYSSGLAWLILVSVLLLAYVLRPSRRNAREIGAYVILLLIAIGGWYLIRRGAIEKAWEFYVVIFAPTIWYLVHIFWISTLSPNHVHSREK